MNCILLGGGAVHTKIDLYVYISFCVCVWLISVYNNWMNEGRKNMPESTPKNLYWTQCMYNIYIYMCVWISMYKCKERGAYIAQLKERKEINKIGYLRLGKWKRKG